MSEPRIAALNLYPVKSCRGIARGRASMPMSKNRQ